MSQKIVTVINGENTIFTKWSGNPPIFSVLQK